MAIRITMEDLKVGQVFPTTKGGDVTVKRIGINSHFITVQFNDKRKYRKVVHLQTLIKGQILNPYFPYLFGVGYLGVGPYMTKRQTSVAGRAYGTWYDMIKKCYGENPTHTMDPSWHKYQNYARWYHKQIKPEDSRYYVNLNLIHPKNKHYSPRTVFLIPTVFMKNLSPPRVSYSIYPTGVTKPRSSSNRFKAVIGKTHLGTYDTVEEAQEVYIKEVVRSMHASADKFKDEMEPRAYELLKAWVYTVYE